MKPLVNNNQFGNTIYWTATFFVTALSAFAIFHQLGIRSLWYDEVRTVLYYAPHPFKITNGDPPVFPFILNIITRFTHSEFWLRFPSAVAFISSTAVIAIGYRKLVGRNVALIAALTLATSYFALTKFQLARPYAFFTFFTIVSFYSFQRILQLHNKRWIPVYILTTFLALHTQYCAFMVISAQIIFGIPFILIRIKKDKTLFFRLLLSFAIIILCSLPWYLDLYSHFSAFKNSNHATAPTGFNFSVYINLLNSQFFRKTAIIIPSIFLFLGLILSFLKKNKGGALLIISWLVVSAGTLFQMLAIGKICFASRYFLFFQPAVYLVASFGIIRTAELLSQLSAKKYSQIFFYLLVCIFHVTLCFNQYEDFINYFKYFHHDDTKNLKKLIVELKAPFYSTGFYHPGFGYYKLPIKRRNPIRDLKNCEFVLYTVDSQMNVEGNSQFKNCDIIFLPFQGVGQNYAIFNSKMPISNYWKNTINILDNALNLAPYHKQIEDKLFAACLLYGQQDFTKSLKNYKVIKKREEKFLKQKVKPLKDNIWTPKNITPLFGWGKIEKQGKVSFRWSTRKRSALLLPVYSEKLKKLKINASAYCPKNINFQKIKGWLGNNYLGEQKLSVGQISFSYEIPRFVEKGERRLLFEFSNPVSPESLGQGGDKRVLAINLQSMKPLFSQILPDKMFNIGSSNSASWLGSNWSHAENWDIKPFRWLDGFTGKVFWTISSEQPAGAWEIDFQPFKVSGKTQCVSIIQNDLVLTNFALTDGWKTYNILSPPISSGETLLEFVFDYAISPKEINLGKDSRKLSAAVADVARK